MQKNLLMKCKCIYNEKFFNKLAIEGAYIDIIKSIYDKPTANMLNNAKFKLFL